MTSVLEQLVADLGTEWCPTCRKRAGVVDVHDESGPPNHLGCCDVFIVTDLDCGHQNAAQIPGAEDWVI